MSLKYPNVSKINDRDSRLCSKVLVSGNSKSKKSRPIQSTIEKSYTVTETWKAKADA